MKDGVLNCGGLVVLIVDELSIFRRRASRQAADETKSQNKEAKAKEIAKTKASKAFKKRKKYALDSVKKDDIAHAILKE